MNAKHCWFDSLPLHYLGISVRSEHALENVGIFTIGQLKEYSEDNPIWLTSGLSIRSAEAIRKAIVKFEKKYPHSPNPLWTDDFGGTMPGPDGCTLLMNPCITKR